MKHRAIGVDIGCTSAKLGLVTRDLRIIRRATVSCGPREPWRKLLGRIADTASSLAKGSMVRGVGVGCAGCVNNVSGVVHLSPNFPLWKKVPLKRFMESRLGIPCVLDNDVNMFMLAEYRCGAARGVENAFCVTVGTGVGGGLILRGELYRGRSMSAGEVGHIQVVPRGRVCGCGNRGCLERYIGKDGLVYLARRAMRGRKSLLRRERLLTPKAIEDAARHGDPAARAVWEKAGYYLGLTLVGVVNLFNPDVIVIGGGISKAGRLLLDPARRIVRRRALPVPARHVRIVRSALGQNGGIIGAAIETFRHGSF
jgi:glucokinase